MSATSLRLQLHAADYLPIPLYGKVPPFKGWSKLQDVTPAQIERWEHVWPNAGNTGVLTRRMPTLDADILDEAAVRAVEDHVRARFDQRGCVLTRVGLPPKRAFPFRTDEPFRKILANVIAASGKAEKVEFLAAGQQVACFGIHPDTKQPYQWHGGAPGQIPRAALPCIGASEARQLVDDVVDLLVRKHGYTRAPKRGCQGNSGHDAGAAGGGAADWQYLLDNIRGGRELHDSLRDLAAKMVAAGMSAGAAINQLRALMQGSAAPHDARWQERYEEIPRLVESAEELRERAPDRVRLEDFVAYMPMHTYIFMPTREAWPAPSVNARVPAIAREGGKTIAASAWLDANAPVEQMTWAPGEPMLVKDRLISGGGWIERQGCTVFNLYRPPVVVPGNAAEAGRWLDHLHKVFGDDDRHIAYWLAHRVQRPHEKINHALVLGGAQGIGKDTLLEPVKRAVGPWNFCEVSPQHMLGRFNGYLNSVILRINEARDLGEVDRFQFYDHMKAYTAAPPDVLRVDEKNLREYSVLNCCGVIITTNHKADGIFLPADDRRHYVAWSELTKGDFVPSYWNDLWGWYARGGDRHVTAYLAELDIASFDAKAPPPRTPAFWDIVDASRAPEDAEFADALDKLGNPDATTLARLAQAATGDFEDWIRDRKNRRVIPYRLERCGYVPVRNDAAESGLWVISGVRQVVYAKAALSIRGRIEAARALAKQ
jgi:hypothetical protein